MRLPEIKRRKCRTVNVGGVVIGAGAPVSVQTMTNTRTADTAATIAQVKRLAAAGADIIRVAVPTADDTRNLARIVKASPVPIVADVHFHFDRALEAIDAGVAKIRLNPGNINDATQVRRVIAAAKDAGVAIRVGVNEGSIVERGDKKRFAVERKKKLVDLMADKMADYLEIFHENKFRNLVLSAKSRDAFTCIAINRELAARWDYPLHLGVTHAGTAETGAIRSAAAIGTLLAEGIGDTIRISFAGDPAPEVQAGLELLWSLRLRKRTGLELIACPTCGRLQMDIAPVVKALQTSLAKLKKHVCVAVMGCVVNGPGEAQDADVAICAGKGKAVLYRRGKIVRAVPQSQIVRAVLAEVKKVAGKS